MRCRFSVPDTLFLNTTPILVNTNLKKGCGGWAEWMQDCSVRTPRTNKTATRDLQGSELLKEDTLEGRETHLWIDNHEDLPRDRFDKAGAVEAEPTEPECSPHALSHGLDRGPQQPTAWPRSFNLDILPFFQ